MATLFSYCIPYDDGAAPNPFWGRCTLVICKPQIRRVAQEGDWIVGTGSKRSPIGDISGQVVYAMRVSKVMTMRDYDRFAHRKCRGKIANWNHRDPLRRVGDAIFDFRTNPPRMRVSVHSDNVLANRRRDLSGENALISDHFFYFGDKPRRLPRQLRRLARQGQGFQSRKNEGLLEPFLEWLYGLGLKPNQLYGLPQIDDFIKGDTDDGLCSHRTRCQPMRKRPNRNGGSRTGRC